jgi:recombination protein RecA
MGKLLDSTAILDELTEKINKKMGAEVLVRGNRLRRTIPRVSTGVLAFDLAAGGGLPLNQWVEIVGEESSGKTALTLGIIAYNMSIDPEYVVIWVAAEEFVVEYAEAIGVDMDRLWVIESNEMEPALELVLKAVNQRAVDAVVIDSLPALVTATEANKEAGDASVATGAQILSRFFKKAAKAQRRSMLEGVEDRNVMLICINQWRDKIGVMFGDPRTTPGGRAKNYYYFIRIDLRRDDWIAEGTSNDKRVGQTIVGRFFKNKTYRPQQYATVDFYFADTTDGSIRKGTFDRVKDVCNVAFSLELFEGRYKWKGERIGKSKEEVFDRVRQDIGLQRELYEAALVQMLPHLKEHNDELSTGGGSDRHDEGDAGEAGEHRGSAPDADAA